MQRRGLDEGGQTRNLGKIENIYFAGLLWFWIILNFTVYLVLHEADKRADDEGDAGTPLLVQEGRHLVDQRLARARGQQGEGAADQSEVSTYLHHSTNQRPVLYLTFSPPVSW